MDINEWIWKVSIADPINIDSLDGFTFQNQLTSIMLVMPSGQHLHAIF